MWNKWLTQGSATYVKLNSWSGKLMMKEHRSRKHAVWPVLGWDHVGNQSTRHVINSSHHFTVWRVDCHVWWRCDELTVLLLTYSISRIQDLHRCWWLRYCTRCNDLPCCRPTCNYVQRLVSFKFPRPQITVVTNHPCYDSDIKPK